MPAPSRRVAAVGTWAFDVEQQEAPSFNMPNYDDKRLEDKFIIASPSRPAVAYHLSGRGFGTWAFDVEVQDAPSFNFLDPDDNESLASMVCGSFKLGQSNLGVERILLLVMYKELKGPSCLTYVERYCTDVLQFKHNTFPGFLGLSTTDAS